MSRSEIILRGIGTDRVKTMGYFKKQVMVNDEEISLLLHVIPQEATNFKAIVGNDLFESADISIVNGTTIVYKKEKDNFLMKISIAKTGEQSRINVDHLEDVQVQKEIRDIVENYTPNKTRGCDIKMKIVLKDEQPVYEHPRRLSVDEKKEVDMQLEEWLQEGIIRSSSSDFASAIVLVKKKDGRTRICCDCRKINRKIIKDRFPLPLIEDILDSLQGAKYFSTIDLRNGFFHVDVEEDSRRYTSFVTHNGQFEFLKCPFGLCNSPAVFQRYISHILRELTIENIALYYMDDIIVISSSMKEGIERLKRVLKIASEYGLDIKKSKCRFLQKRVEFFGYIIEEGKIQPSGEKSIAIKRFPKPTTHKQVQSFLGLTGYFRKFIPSYALIAKPLSDLLKQDTAFLFGNDQEAAFEKLKQLLSSAPVLHIYQQNSETQLHTDASKYGYGACLMQKGKDDNKFHPIYYTSKKTTPAEERYSSYELEVLAIIQAVKKFRIYLLGISFKIVTDCAAFQKTMSKKDLTTRVARWALLLEEYTFEIEHRSGSRMMHVDALSRYPVVMVMQDILREDGITERLKKAQDRDDYIKAIKKISATEEYQNFFLRNDVLYKYENGIELIVVPKSMQYEIIKKAHEMGHFGVAKTEEIVKREFIY